MRSLTHKRKIFMLKCTCSANEELYLVIRRRHVLLWYADSSLNHEWSKTASFVSCLDACLEAVGVRSPLDGTAGHNRTLIGLGAEWTQFGLHPPLYTHNRRRCHCDRQICFIFPIIDVVAEAQLNAAKDVVRWNRMNLYYLAKSDSKHIISGLLCYCIYVT
jgi:hypothetical protein